MELKEKKMHVAKNRIFSLVLFVSIIMTNYVHADVRPGETCSSVLKLVYQTAFDVGFWEGAMSMAYVEANKKREAGDKREEKGALNNAGTYSDKMKKGLPAYGGAIKLAETLDCNANEIKEAALCGYVKKKGYEVCGP
jgi:hypothetical protein